jgi:hypothetical protein
MSAMRNLLILAREYHVGEVTMRSGAIALVVVFVTAPVFADQATIHPQASMRFGALRSKKPKTQLFTLQQPLQDARKADAAPLKPKVVCGMMIVPADPTIDPKMRVTPPQDPKLEYKIRVVEPPMCKATR